MCAGNGILVLWSIRMQLLNQLNGTTGPSFLEKPIVCLLNGAHCMAVLIALLCRPEDLGLNPQNHIKKMLYRISII